MVVLILFSSDPMSMLDITAMGASHQRENVHTWRWGHLGMKQIFSVWASFRDDITAAVALAGLSFWSVIETGSHLISASAGGTFWNTVESFNLGVIWLKRPHLAYDFGRLCQ